MRKFRTDSKPIDLAIAFQLHWVYQQSLHRVAAQCGIHHTNLMMRFRRFGLPTRERRTAMILAGGPLPRYGDENPSWKGGITKTKRGYWIRNSDKKYLHRIIAEKVLGRPLKRNEDVHHIDGDPSNNVHNNLLICSKNYHHWLHAKMENFQIGINHRR